VVDRLRQLGVPHVIGVNFAGRPDGWAPEGTGPLYANKRAEIWFEVRDWLRAGGAIPDLVDLKQDLAAPTYRFTPADKIQLESKDDIKARGLPSPDMGDALALTFSFPVYVDHSAQARARSMGLPTIDEANSLDYDPYRRL
jgi:hypothetical protein